MEELRSKYPKRREHLKWPDDEIAEEIDNGKLLEKINNLSEVGYTDTLPQLKTGTGTPIEAEELSEKKDTRILLRELLTSNQTRNLQTTLVAVDKQLMLPLKTLLWLLSG